MNPKISKINTGAICGGIISESIHQQNVKKYGIEYDLMSFIMPDNKYRKYITLYKQNKRKEAQELFKKYAQSQI